VKRPFLLYTDYLFHGFSIGRGKAQRVERLVNDGLKQYFLTLHIQPCITRLVQYLPDKMILSKRALVDQVKVGILHGHVRVLPGEIDQSEHGGDRCPEIVRNAVDKAVQLRVPLAEFEIRLLQFDFRFLSNVNFFVQSACTLKYLRLQVFVEFQQRFLGNGSFLHRRRKDECGDTHDCDKYLEQQYRIIGIEQNKRALSIHCEVDGQQ